MRINYKEGQGNVRRNYVTILHIIGKINIVIVNTRLTADRYISHNDLLRLMLEFLNSLLHVTWHFKHIVLAAIVPGNPVATCLLEIRGSGAKFYGLNALPDASQHK